MLVSYTGKTNKTFKPKRMENYKPEPPQFDGNYGVNVAKCRKALELLACIANHPTRKGYLITMTWSPDYDDDHRFKMKAKFLDMIRKRVMAYVWVTELHKGFDKETGECYPNYGNKHFHIFVVTSQLWNYAKYIQKWSPRYCQSSNGLDIKPRNYPQYLGKYLQKDQGELKYPARLWGYKGFQLWHEVRMPYSWNEFYMTARCMCHIYSGTLIATNMQAIADMYEGQINYEELPIFEETEGNFADNLNQEQCLINTDLQYLTQ